MDNLYMNVKCRENFDAAKTNSMFMSLYQAEQQPHDDKYYAKQIKKGADPMALCVIDPNTPEARSEKGAIFKRLIEMNFKKAFMASLAKIDLNDPVFDSESDVYFKDDLSRVIFGNEDSLEISMEDRVFYATELLKHGLHPNVKGYTHGTLYADLHAFVHGTPCDGFGLISGFREDTRTAKEESDRIWDVTVYRDSSKDYQKAGIKDYIAGALFEDDVIPKRKSDYLSRLRYENVLCRHGYDASSTYLVSSLFQRHGSQYNKDDALTFLRDKKADPMALCVINPYKPEAYLEKGFIFTNLIRWNLRDAFLFALKEVDLNHQIFDAESKYSFKDRLAEAVFGSDKLTQADRLFYASKLLQKGLNPNEAIYEDKSFGENLRNLCDQIEESPHNEDEIRMNASSTASCAVNQARTLLQKAEQIWTCPTEDLEKQKAEAEANFSGVESVLKSRRQLFGADTFTTMTESERSKVKA